MKKNYLEEIERKYNGHFFTSDLLSEGFSKYDISNLVNEGILKKVDFGKYVYFNSIDDDFKIIQGKNNNMIFSHETALYLHNLVDRFPVEIDVTTYSGYHVRRKDVKIHYVKKDLLKLGIEKLIDDWGNEVLVYDKERTICDIIKGRKKIDPQIYYSGLQNYFLNNKLDIKKLAFYSKQLDITERVAEIVSLYRNS